MWTNLTNPTRTLNVILTVWCSIWRQDSVVGVTTLQIGSIAGRCRRCSSAPRHLDCLWVQPTSYSVVLGVLSLGQSWCGSIRLSPPIFLRGVDRGNFISAYGSWDSAVGVVSGLLAGRYRVWILARLGDFSLLQNAYISSGAHHTWYSMSTGVLSWDYSCRSMKLIIHLHLCWG